MRILRTSGRLMCGKLAQRKIHILITTENFTLVTLLLRAIEPWAAREMGRVVDASQEAQKALGGGVPRSALSNTLRRRDLE
jgi:hypothetical protein